MMVAQRAFRDRGQKKSPAGAGRRCLSWCRASWPAQGPSCSPQSMRRSTSEPAARVERVGFSLPQAAHGRLYRRSHGGGRPAATAILHGLARGIASTLFTLASSPFRINQSPNATKAKFRLRDLAGTAAPQWKPREALGRALGFLTLRMRRVVREWLSSRLPGREIMHNCSN